MAYHVSDNVYTHTFTPREYQVELLESAKKKNTIVCSSTSAAKAFIAVKLVQEYSWQMRSSTGKRALFILDPQNVKVMTTQIELLTDLSVICIESVEELDWETIILENSVIVLTAEICTDLLSLGYLCFSHLNLIVIDDCLHGVRQKLIEKLLLKYDELLVDKPRILGLVGGLLGTDMQPMLLEAEMQRLEILLRSSVDTYSELVTLLRLCCHPHEHILECGQMVSLPIYDTLRCHILKAKEFILDHRFDPSEIYSDEFLEELRRVPDPKVQPLEILNDILHVLEGLGPWAADQAALSALVLIEKLKVKIPYERHYLLLCMISTVMVLIRAHCETVFSGLDEKDKIFQFTTPKVLRFLEVIREFKPSNYEKPPEMNEQAVTEITMTNNNKNSNHNNNINFINNYNNNMINNHNNNNNNNVGNVRTGRKSYRGIRRCQIFRQQLDDVLCALVFVHKRCTAKVLFTLLSTMSQCDPDYWWVSTLYTVEKITDPTKEPREAETEHRRQEEVLRKYRAHECNIMIATSVLEQGCDLPKCNLVIRFDLPLSFHSYVQSKARARVTDSHYLLMATESELASFTRQLAIYTQVENTLLRRCYCLEPDDKEKAEADCYNATVQPYKPLDDPESQSVSLSTSIQLVNKYCAKLPSDTFTRLTPLWEVEQVAPNAYVCSLRLPINSPVKQTVISPPMPNSLLARRVAAFFTCRLLHQAGELDDNLQPVGKENFKASEEDWNHFPLEPADEELTKENVEQRPGTTKRRQYYYKRIADALLDCHPKPNEPTYLYKIVMILTCPLPEEQNTRGRKIYPPEESPQGFGILTCKPIPTICPFPIFTRSGEVSVSLELCSHNEILTSDNIYKISEFGNYTFTSVLRLQRYLMVFQPDVADSSYLITPTCEDSNGVSRIDWNFIELIYQNRDVLPRSIADEDRVGYQFEPAQYRDAVVMPWYRNRDQPQYFYVAEICTNLNPKSAFPGSEYATFEEYYLRKYDIKIQNGEQHLLDVDHTSARLNFLTPRYVNRKGVALPTSSEETKRAKRENLEQKQILVPELCAIHPFPASLWRKAVCLPCILYRINALLLADQIRTTVAEEIGLGKLNLPEGFEWPTLNFGWSLLDVLKKSKPLLDASKKEAVTTAPNGTETIADTEKTRIKSENRQPLSDESLQDDDSGTGEEFIAQPRSDDDAKDWMEIGTWSNDMIDANNALPDGTMVRYASPTSWLPNAYDDEDDDDDDDDEEEDNDEYDDDDVDFSDIDDSFSADESECDYSNEKLGFADVDYEGDDKNRRRHRLRQRHHHNHHHHTTNHHRSDANEEHLLKLADSWKNYDEMGKEHGEMCGEWCGELKARCQAEFLESCERNEAMIRNTDILVPKTVPFKKGVESDETEKEVIRKSLDVEIICPSYDAATTDFELIPPIDQMESSSFDECLFSFDEQPNLEDHPGPSPSVILQALTMSNANDGINLERLETIGDSFLKYAITDYLYSKYENIHEGKLSHLRSKQVSNLNLYRLGKKKNLGECMIATKFDPHDNWLPPCFYVPKELEEALIDSRMPPNYFSLPIMSAPRKMTLEEMCDLVREHRGNESVELDKNVIPYNLVTQHSIPDKSVADCVEALIGAYLIECGPYGALLFMAWLGIRVLPCSEDGTYGKLDCPKSPLLRHVNDPEGELKILLDGYDKFEESIGYRFRDRSYLLQALTHASYSPNTLTDCYQRLEFLGDAVLDYLITRHLYEDSRMHSPGALTDLRSALVNNTIFASLAVRHAFHKYFRHLSPGLHEVVERFIRLQEESGHVLVEELYLLAEHECEEVEDVEVPKALGDVFESVAGAIYLDSGRSLDAVWKVYYRMMKNEIEQFSNRVPKSPIRELLELEPETAKFGTPEKLADGRRVRVTVEVFGKGVFKGIGRNYRIAKCTAAKCALKHLKRQNSIRKS